jgi:hypothetical protein
MQALDYTGLGILGSWMGWGTMVLYRWLGLLSSGLGDWFKGELTTGAIAKI